MSAISILSKNNDSGDEDIDPGMEGNICRCGTYVRIRRAMHEAVTTLKRTT